MSGKIFAVCFPVQEAQISAWCWGKCGHGIFGAVDLGPCHGVMCRYEDCPHLDRVTDTPIGQLDGEDVYVRKLKAVSP